jgi:glucose/mannose-6-phosphate isomerase
MSELFLLSKNIGKKVIHLHIDRIINKISLEVNMGTLDTEEKIKKLDTEGMLQSISDLPYQMENAWNELKNFVIPTPYIKCNKILILGMGGSAIGGDLVSSLSLNYSKAPIIVQRDYGLPNFVDSNTLVIGVSYSGKTEETLDAFKMAGERNAKLIAISTGGEIESVARKYNAPIFKISYGAQPRAALGYLFTAILYIFYKLDFISLGQNEIVNAIEVMKEYQKEICTESPTSHNPAKQLAEKIKDRIPVIIGAGTMSTIARRWKTQINENSKQAAFYEVFPELCHNLIVGLDWPKKLGEKIYFLVLESEFDHPRNKIRQSVIGQIFRKKGVGYETIVMKKAFSPLVEMMQMILLGDYTSYYLGILNGVNPTTIEMITFLKNKLAESK